MLIHSLSLRETLTTPSIFYSSYTFLCYFLLTLASSILPLQVVLNTTLPKFPSHNDMNY